MAKRNSNQDRRQLAPPAQRTCEPGTGGPASIATTQPLRLLGRGLTGFISLLLFVLVIAVYLPSIRNGFVNYDDDVYLCQNTHVLRGLTWQSIKWAFTNLEAGFWHPLTWLSLLLDFQLYGLQAWGYHLTSLMMHAANAVLLYLVLQRMTGATWRSAFVALLFGLHPLHVESVAWVAERKDVLSTLFWMLTMWMYAQYVEKSQAKSLEPEVSEKRSAASLQGPESAIRISPSPGTSSRATNPASLYYALALAFFVCGLMSKTMVVTLPIVLLLLDWWPLQRFQLKTQHSTFRTLLTLTWEKAPFLGSALVLGLVTIYSERAVGAISSTAHYSLSDRAHNAIISCLCYLRQTFWPVDLAVFYPYPTNFPFWPAAGGALMLMAISLMVVWKSRGREYLALGWGWYVVTLVPVIGLIQIGSFARADRYTYVPLVGIFVMLTWGACELTRHLRLPRGLLSGAGAAAVVLCAMLTCQQLRYWRDGASLFGHAVAVTANNSMVRQNYCAALLGLGRFEDALRQSQEAARLAPTEIGPRVNLGLILMKLGRLDEAIGQLQAAIQLKPEDPAGHRGLGDALSAKGRLPEAINAYREALKLSPNNAVAHLNLGVALDQQERPEEALAEFREAVEFNPAFFEARHELGIALAKRGKLDEAIAELQAAVRLAGNNAEAHKRLGDVLLAAGRMDAAAAQYRAAIQFAPGDPIAHHSLGVVLGMSDQRDAAIEQFEEAVHLDAGYAEAQGNLGIALMKQGRVEEAISRLQEASRLNPGQVEVRRNLALALGGRGRLEAAIAQFEEVLRLNPADAEAHSDLGVALGRQGRLAEAIVHFKEALKLKPDYAEAQRNLQIALDQKSAVPAKSP